MGNKEHKEKLKDLNDEETERYAKLLNASVDEIKELFEIYKRCHDASTGKLTKEEFTKYFKNFYASKNIDQPNTFIEQIFDLFDYNNDGKMSFEEFLSGNIYLTGNDKKKSLEIMFSILDLDKDNYINQKELEIICIATRPFLESGIIKNTYVKNGKDDAERLMKKLDNQNQGRINKDTFISCLMNDPELQAFQKRFNLSARIEQEINDRKQMLSDQNQYLSMLASKQLNKS